MQMCPNCDHVYDESEYARCPRCHKDDYDDYRESKPEKFLVWDPKTGEWEEPKGRRKRR